MKKTLFILLTYTIALPAFSQVSTPPSLGGGMGVGLPGAGLSLQQLKDSALQNNLAVRSARHNVEAAKEQRQEAFTKYFPNVSAMGAWFNASKGTAKMTIDPQDIIPEQMLPSLSQMLPAEALAALSSPVSLSMMKHGTIAGITALQPVFAGGQIVNGNRLAKVGQEAAALQLSLSEREVEKQTEQYYWQLATLQQKMLTANAADTLLSDICHDVEVAVGAGVALRNDLLQVQLRRNEVQSQRLKLQNGIQLVSLLLAQYCGLSSSLEFRVESAEFATAPDNSLEGSAEGTAVANSKLYTPNSTLDVLPEYQLLQKQVEAAKLQKKMAVGQQLPTVAVGAGYNYHTLMDCDRSFGMVFATVSVPISDWWGGSHAIKRKKIAQRQAEEQLQDNAELLGIRQQKAGNDVVEAHSQLLLAQRSVEQADENLRLHRDYYRAGTATMSDLLQAQLLCQQAADQLADAYAALQISLLEYRQATE